MWEPQLTLAELGWHVIAPHFRCFDRSDGGPPASSVDDYAGDVIDLLDALHIHDAVVGGLSMGGYVAFAVLRHAASYIRGLILADTKATADTPEGVQARLREQGRGFAVRSARVPIVPAASLFDLLNGGDKQWGLVSPYRDFGLAAVDAAGRDFALGSAGAGFGATTADLRGGLGSASAVSAEGYTVGALVAVNAVGQATIGEGPHFWAVPYEIGSEFGGLGWPVPFPATALTLRAKGQPAGNTTIAVVATDAMLTKPQARRLAVAAQDGLARAIRPVHTPLDGDTVFAAATGARALHDPVWNLASLGALAADVLARAVARGVYMAASSTGLADMPPSWKDRFGR